jgi:RNA polymerase sigma-70 factor (ECF subfamily)
MLGYRNDLEDIVQAAMEAFLKSRASFRGEGSIEGFADSIAANVARRWMYKQRRSIFIHELAADRGPWPEPPGGPDQEHENKDKVRRLLEILGRLKPKYRMACVLYYVEGKTVAQIAEIEGKSENAIRKRILRGRQEVHRRANHDPVLSEWLAEMRGAR